MVASFECVAVGAEEEEEEEKEKEEEEEEERSFPSSSIASSLCMKKRNIVPEFSILGLMQQQI